MTNEQRLPSPTQQRRDDICIHIFTVSATLVGVCLTVIGVLRIVKRLQGVAILADQVLSVNAMGFLAACMIAYAAVRTEGVERRKRLERSADVVFLFSLAMMTVVCALIAREFV